MRHALSNLILLPINVPSLVGLIRRSFAVRNSGIEFGTCEVTVDDSNIFVIDSDMLRSSTNLLMVGIIKS